MNKKQILLSFLMVTLGAYSENISKINLKTNVKKSAVENFINKEIPETFTGNETISLASNSTGDILNLGLSLLGRRGSKYSPNIVVNYVVNRGKIAFSLENWNLTGETDFNGTVVGNLQGSNSKFNSNFNGALGVKSNVFLSENWDLITKTSPNLKLDRVILPVNASISGFKINENINIRDQIAKQITPVLNKTAADLDKKIGEINLKSLIENYWKTLKEPILLDKDLDIWLLARPKSAYYGNLSSDTNNISLNSGIEGEFTIFVGKPESVSNLGALPKLKTTSQDISKFNLNIPGVIKFSKLENILNQNFANKIFDIFTGVKLENKKINLQGDNKELKLKTEFSLKIFNIFSMDGILIGKGTPEIFENKELQIKGFTFEIESESFILNLLDKFFHKKIQGIVEKNYLTLDFEKDLTGIKKLLQEKTAHFKINEALHLNSSIDELKISNVEIRDQEIIIYTSILGSSVLDITSIE